MKTVMVMSDLHCGHLVGLTPPSRHATLAKNASKTAKALEKIRQELWRLFALEVKARPIPDVLVINGDCMDGLQKRGGGSELLAECADMQVQADIAAECIKFVKAPAVYMTYGTPYHCASDGADYERTVRNLVLDSKYTKECHLKSHLYLDVNGTVLDIKHKVGASGIPHGRHTAVAKEILWNKLWAEEGVSKKADILIRSHVHYAAYCGGPRHLAMTTPALQGLGSKYGARQCSGIVDWGFTWFDIHGKGDYGWEYVIPAAANQAQQAEVLKAK